MSLYKVRILIECVSRTCVKENVEENGIPNHPSEIPSEEVNFGSRTR